MDSYNELDLKLFYNEPNFDATKESDRNRFKKAIETVRSQLGKTYPVFINGHEIQTKQTIICINPNNTEEILGTVCSADKQLAGEAVSCAKNAFSTWKRTHTIDRARYLIKAADIVRRQKYEFAAWQVLEVGKQWEQAYNDVNEAIDFLEYYAREILRIGKAVHLRSVAGETNWQFYEPRGVAVVIAPWNFPLAISIGMVSAAIVTGNTVVYKPSESSSISGYLLVKIFREIGLPNGVFNYLPGYGDEIGPYLVQSHEVNTIVFTGSLQTGLRILEEASKVHPGQSQIKKVICEMGGKNAIIIDEDADLDIAIPAVIASAFGYQGQKCSACSRLIIHENIYEKMVDKLIEVVKELKMGPSENPAYDLGALINVEAQEKNLKYQDVATQEGKILFKSTVPNGNGYYVPIMIVGEVTPEMSIAQEEVFGPLLCAMRAKDFDQALELANSTAYALTGGVFSRSPKNLEKAKEEFHVGNLYLNRGITGACVERQPFGGAYMSGTGTKAGGQDYLLHFMYPRVVTENTMRRGFAADT